MISEIIAFLALYSLFRGMRVFMLRRSGRKKYKMMEGAEPFFYKKGEKGLLFVHGFTSSPSDLRDKGKYFSDRNITFSAPLIAGHGTSPYNLAMTGWKDWLSSVEKALKNLKKEVDKVYLGGVSAGGNIALCLASKHNIDGVISIGTPIKFRKEHVYKTLFPFLGLFKSFQRKWYRNLIDKEIQEKRIGYHLIPLNSVAKVVALVEESKRALPQITAPSLIMQSTNDFGINPSSVDYIYKNINSMKKKVVWVKDAYHVLIVDKNKEKTFAEMYNFIMEN